MALPRWIPGSSPGSQLRNLFTYWILFLVSVLIAEAIFAFYARPLLSAAWMGPVLGIFAVVYFGVVVIGAIFIVSHQLGINPLRLARDSVVSIVFTIMAFSVWYRQLGITMDVACPTPIAVSSRDAVYFSAVTFSTLGYGDFRPCEAARIWAAGQAILGNLHLGLIVGAAFFFVQAAVHRDQSLPAQKQLKKPRNNDN
ncbi:MAG: ion channel [Rhodobacter sp.]|nr:ion channel [Rhodobacter sp.]